MPSDHLSPAPLPVQRFGTCPRRYRSLRPKASNLLHVRSLIFRISVDLGLSPALYWQPQRITSGTDLVRWTRGHSMAARKNRQERGLRACQASAKNRQCACAITMAPGRDARHRAPAGQIRTSASIHTALMKDECRGSECEDGDGGSGVWVSTCRRPKSVTPTSCLRIDCHEPERFARAN